jgi:hypothetical protein
VTTTLKYPKYWCHQKANLDWQGSWGATCLIEQVIPPRIDSAHTYQMHLLRHRNVHWTILETISDEFVASEAMCCNKRHQVAEKSCNPDWDFSFYVLEHPQAPYNILSIEGNIAMCPVYTITHITMWPHRLVVTRVVQYISITSGARFFGGIL